MCWWQFACACLQGMLSVKCCRAAIRRNPVIVISPHARPAPHKRRLELEAQIRDKAARAAAAKAAVAAEDRRKEAELVSRGDPWGRGGAGAPLRGADGRVVTDLKSLRVAEGASNQQAQQHMQQQHAQQQHMQQLQLQQPGGGYQGAAGDWGGGGGGGGEPLSASSSQQRLANGGGSESLLRELAVAREQLKKELAVAREEAAEAQQSVGGRALGLR